MRIANFFSFDEPKFWSYKTTVKIVNLEKTVARCERNGGPNNCPLATAALVCVGRWTCRRQQLRLC